MKRIAKIANKVNLSPEQGIFVGIYPMELATVIRMSYGNIGETKGWIGLAQAAINNSIKTIFMPVVTA